MKLHYYDGPALRLRVLVLGAVATAACGCAGQPKKQGGVEAPSAVSTHTSSTSLQDILSLLTAPQRLQQLTPGTVVDELRWLMPALHEDGKSNGGWAFRGSLESGLVREVIVTFLPEESSWRMGTIQVKVQGERGNVLWDDVRRSIESRMHDPAWKDSDSGRVNGMGWKLGDHLELRALPSAANAVWLDAGEVEGESDE